MVLHGHPTDLPPWTAIPNPVPFRMPTGAVHGAQVAYRSGRTGPGGMRETVREGWERYLAPAGTTGCGSVPRGCRGWDGGGSPPLRAADDLRQGLK